ncbi:hypothetical protein FQN50_006296 [Emmonsiellopsis sp. PD_5]|nr:hypothetical protein FQN50_006296 [Emmonsiellopsis sp. PD_5]
MPSSPEVNPSNLIRVLMKRITSSNEGDENTGLYPPWCAGAEDTYETIDLFPPWRTIEDALDPLQYLTRAEKLTIRNLQYSFNGEQVEPNRTLESLNLKVGDVVEASGRRLGDEQTRLLASLTYKGPWSKDESSDDFSFLAD